jgi:hypothetical protein
MNVIRVHLLFLALVPAFALAATSKKQSVELEIHDTVRAELVRAIPASSLAYGDVLKKVGKLRSTHAISLRCNGFGYGRLSDDLYYSGGRPNSSLAADSKTSLMDVCKRMEDTFKAKSR